MSYFRAIYMKAQHLFKWFQNLKTYNINNILLVADRAMFTERIYCFMDKLGITYIVAAKLKTLPNKLKEEILESSELRAAVAGNELHWLKEFEHKNRRLIVSYTQGFKRRKDRQRLIDRLMKKVKPAHPDQGSYPELRKQKIHKH